MTQRHQLHHASPQHNAGAGTNDPHLPTPAPWSHHQGLITLIIIKLYMTVPWSLVLPRILLCEKSFVMFYSCCYNRMNPGNPEFLLHIWPNPHRFGPIKSRKNRDAYGLAFGQSWLLGTEKAELCEDPIVGLYRIACLQ